MVCTWNWALFWISHAISSLTSFNCSPKDWEVVLILRRRLYILRRGSCISPMVFTISPMLLCTVSAASLAVCKCGTRVSSCCDSAVSDSRVWSFPAKILSLLALHFCLALSAEETPDCTWLMPSRMDSTDLAICSRLSYKASPASFHVSFASFRSLIWFRSSIVPGAIAMITPVVSKLSVPIRTV